MSKTHVAVLMGGVSSEHDVSLKSGARVAENLDPETYRVTQVTIERDGCWLFPGREPMPIQQAASYLCSLEIDCVFPALHGPFGEDGRIQGFLDLLGLPYVGSGCAASALAIDKIRCKSVVQSAGIRVAGQITVDAREWETRPAALASRIESELGFPCVMKSPCQGSSLGMAIPDNRRALEQSMGGLFELDDVVLVEEYVTGVEVTCSVLDVEAHAAPRPLPVTEIVPVSTAFFDYQAKYTPGACREITPARISETATARVQGVGVRVHRLVGCQGFSRSDMILDGEEPVWLEVNTLPGMTETSLFPQAAASVGISYRELVGLLVEDALRRRP